VSGKIVTAGVQRVLVDGRRNDAVDFVSECRVDGVFDGAPGDLPGALYRDVSFF
jgi:hypothetical protein